MPRKSAASLHFATVNGSSKRLRPPPELSEIERQIFLDLVGGAKPEHFRTTDAPLLAAYCRAVALETRSAAELAAGDTRALVRWEKATKAMVAFSMRLRLSPQGRSPTTPSKSGTPPPPMSYYDRMRLEESDAADSE